MAEDSWESIGWEATWAQQDEPDREQVLHLARRLAQQREHQRTQDLIQIEELKRALRERAADVAQRELEVERRERDLEDGGPESPRRMLRFRRAAQPPQVPVDENRAYTEEILARREADVEQRTQAVDTRERDWPSVKRRCWRGSSSWMKPVRRSPRANER